METGNDMQQRSLMWINDFVAHGHVFIYLFMCVCMYLFI